jgi:hypothetical protein
VARNGRVLLASPVPLAELNGQILRVRFQVWHRRILPGELPESYGILFCVDERPLDPSVSVYTTGLIKRGSETFDLSLDVGGGLNVEFRRIDQTDLKSAMNR